MGFDVLCESCGKRLSIPAPLFERKVQGRVVTISCKTCGAPIRIDATLPPPPPAPSSSASARASISPSSVPVDTEDTDSQWSDIDIPKPGRLPTSGESESKLGVEGAPAEGATAGNEPLAPGDVALGDPPLLPGGAGLGDDLLPPDEGARAGERLPGGVTVGDEAQLAQVAASPVEVSAYELAPQALGFHFPTSSAPPPDVEEVENSSELDAGWDKTPHSPNPGFPVELLGASPAALHTPFAVPIQPAPLGSFLHEDGPISTRAPMATIGRYALFEKFATGGMATVHLGRLDGAGGFSRVVAIKRLLPHLLQNTEFAEMLLKEARLAARVRHPNVVPTLDVVASKGDVLIVLEYVHGEALSALRRRQGKLGGSIPIEIATRILLDVLQGLHAVHGASDEKGRSLGLVHRDVSPQNVIVGVDGIARVLDFGIVKALDQMEQTRPNKLKGKTGYMSPEQIRGERLTRRSDVFSAGIVLWELLTLHRFAAAPTDRERMDWIMGGRYSLPSEHRPDLDKALEEVVMRALAFETEERFASARDFADGLARASDSASVGTVADWVKGLAEDTLMERERLVAQVENWDSRNPDIELSSSPFAAELGVVDLDEVSEEVSRRSKPPRREMSTPAPNAVWGPDARDSSLPRPFSIFMVVVTVVLLYFAFR